MPPFSCGCERYALVVGPFAEELDLALELQNLLGQGLEGGDLDFPVVGHVGRVSWEVVVRVVESSSRACCDQGKLGALA